MRLKLDVSLDDAWAEHNLSLRDVADSLRRVVRDCTVTDSGKVMDPNGNSIGTIEIVED